MITSEVSGFGNSIQKYVVLENNDLIEIEIVDNKISYQENIQSYVLKNNENQKMDELPSTCSHWMQKEIFEQYETIVIHLLNIDQEIERLKKTLRKI